MSECASGSCAKTGGGEKKTDEKLQKTLSLIKHRIVILSGKGGVGKSTVAANLAKALAVEGQRVGLLDVDVHGPSIPRLLSLQGQTPHIDADHMEPVAWSRNLQVMSVGFMLPSKDDAVIWRGPVKMGLIRQFLEDVAWGELDYLIVDCPPGTGDEPLSVLQLLGPEAWAVIVTTPQGVAIDDVRRSVRFCRELGNPVLGIVENMSGFVCPNCGTVHAIFAKGGGEALAKEAHVPFLGAIPIDPEVVRSGDEGYSVLKTKPDSPAAKALGRVVDDILALNVAGGAKACAGCGK